jgi:16S rRNA (cytosine967-C5)-methyltransferase
MRVESGGAYADVLLGNRLSEFEPNDRGLITRLVLGTIAWRARLDYELESLASRPLAELDPEVLQILRLALFQLRFLDRVPQHAVVDTAVNLTRGGIRIAKASGFINAVLRKATRERRALPQRDSDEIGYLAIAWSHPRWMVAKFVEQFGVADAERIMAANNEAAPTAIRLNPARGSLEEIRERIEREGIAIARQGIFPEMLVLDGAPRFDSKAFREGLFHVQSEASQVVSRLLAPTPNATVIDCAAAPGGKTTHLAELADGEAKIVALDANANGLRTAASIAQRLTHRNILFARADIERAIPLRPESADFVLLDAPCTGTGTLREHPEIRWRLKPSDPARLGSIQLAMLRNAASVVRRGGAIVYSVCSLMRDEGEEVVTKFIAQSSGFVLDRSISEELQRFDNGSGAIVMRPDREGLDGFYAARIIHK